MTGETKKTKETKAGTAANQPSQGSGGTEEELNRLIEEVAHSSTAFTDLHRVLLQPGHQITDDQYQLFTYVRGEILADRLSLLEAIEQIKSLRDLSTDFSSSDLLLAKRVGEQLEPWQRNTLGRGFTFNDLCSRWMSLRHAAQVASQQQTVEQLRGLMDYHVIGLANGFTLAHVNSSWFTRLHAEAAQPPFNARITGPAPAPLENILKHMFRIDVATVVSAREWRCIFDAPQAGNDGIRLFQYEETPLDFAASQGHIAMLGAMFVVGGFTPEECRAIINKPLTKGYFAGRTPFYAAASSGGVATVLVLGGAAGCTPQQWRALIEGPLTQGYDEGMTPLYEVALTGNTAVLNILRKVGDYTTAEWRIRITTPLKRGRQAGTTPFFAAANERHDAVVAAMQQACRYTEQEWQALINTPMEYGDHKGQTPLSAAYCKRNLGVLALMQQAGGYPKQEGDTLTAPLSGQRQEAASSSTTTKSRETKKTKETKAGTAANQPSQGSGGTGDVRSTLPLPAELIKNVFDFFRPAELARMAPVSKYLLLAANDLEGSDDFKRSASDRRISFAFGRGEELDRLVEEVAHSSTDFTNLHRILLQPGHQVTDNQCQLFSYVRGEILAGRLSLLEAIEQIDSLRNLSTDFFSSDVLLAKRLRGQVVEAWQRNALRLGFTFSDLCSRWMSCHHGAQVVRGQQTVEQLRDLMDYQAIGLARGFTLEQVRSVWFTPLHAEAAQPPFNMRITTGLTSLENILKLMLGISVTTVIPPEIWQGIFITPAGVEWTLPFEYGGTPLYLAAFCGHITMLRTMFAVGGYTPAVWRAMINKPLLDEGSGNATGRTPFYAAARYGGAATVLALGEAGDCTPQQWRHLIEGPLTQGYEEGMTPLYVAVLGGKSEVLNTMRRVGVYTAAEWWVRITTPLTQGREAGITPFYAAAAQGHVAVVTAIAMQQAYRYTEKEWQTLINTPMKRGTHAGKTPLSIAIRRNHIEVLELMQQAGGYPQQEWDVLIASLSEQDQQATFSSTTIKSR